jgi:hypothetical protein
MSWKNDLNYGLAAFGVQIPDRINVDDWAENLARKPFQNTANLVAVSSVLFYMAERGHNPKVRDIYDAMVYCSTCLNVGYADIFAKTPTGKLIGTFLMTIGPSMAAKATDGVNAVRDDEFQSQVIATLQEIAAKLPARDGVMPEPVDGST